MHVCVVPASLPAANRSSSDSSTRRIRNIRSYSAARPVRGRRVGAPLVCEEAVQRRLKVAQVRQAGAPREPRPRRSAARARSSASSRVEQLAHLGGRVVRAALALARVEVEAVGLLLARRDVVDQLPRRHAAPRAARRRPRRCRRSAPAGRLPPRRARAGAASGRRARRAARPRARSSVGIRSTRLTCDGDDPAPRAARARRGSAAPATTSS